MANRNNENQTVQTLAQQAGLRIPINALFFAKETEGNVINQEFFSHAFMGPIMKGDLLMVLQGFIVCDATQFMFKYGA